MLKQFCKDMKLGSFNLPLLLFAVALTYLVSFGLACLIIYTGDETTWFCMGTVMAMIILVITSALSGLGYHSEFMLALSMGRTRKEFMGSYALRNLLSVGAGYLLILVLYHVEMAVYPLLFPTLSNEVEFTFVTSWWLPLFIPLLTAFSMFIGALYSRFGKKWGWVLWVIWMACCFGLPRLIPDDPETSPVFMFLVNLPGGLWLALGVAAFLGMTVTVLHLGRKQYVH